MKNATLSNLSPDAKIPTGSVPLQNVPAHSLQMITDWICAEPRVILSHGLCCFCESRVQPHGVRARSCCVFGLHTSIVPTCFLLQRQQFSLLKSYSFLLCKLTFRLEHGGEAPPPPPRSRQLEGCVFLGQWSMSSLCHAWQAAFCGGRPNADMFGNLRKRWSNRLSASISLSKPHAHSGHLELIAPVT